MSTDWEGRLLFELLALGVPRPETQFRFHATRRWRFDLAWPAARVAAEVDGGVWTQGRHVRGYGFESDCEKLNEATLLGWRVFRFTPKFIVSGRAQEILRGVLSPSI